MRKALVLAVALLSCASPRGYVSNAPVPYQAEAQRILEAAAQSHAYDRLVALTDQFGPRFSGTENLEHAIDWVLEEMKHDGLENVHGEPVSVPHWVRGQESVELISPRKQSLPMLGIGGSVGTPHDGITADVLVVSSFEELTANAAKARGKIVVYDVPFTGYGKVVAYRWKGASEASKAGAVASLLRSVGSMSLQTPHTGAMRYEQGVTPIPHAAITAEDAAYLHRLQERGVTPRLTIRMGAQTLPDATSRNLIAELRGREKPEEIVVMGGHIDSWDVGQGALDDGGGIMAAWEALRLLKALDLHPRRTIRVVLWTNEENGLKGGFGYRDTHAAELANHVAAIESDNGTFQPTGFRIAGPASALDHVKGWSSLFAPIHATEFTLGDSEADIHPLVEGGIPGFGLSVEGSKYFWYHHTAADTVDKVDPKELKQCVGALALMSYLLAESPERLPSAPAK